MSKFSPLYSSSQPIRRKQSGGFNMDFLNNISSNWKKFMGDPYSQSSNDYLNDLLGRNKDVVTTGNNLYDKLYDKKNSPTVWGDDEHNKYYNETLNGQFTPDQLTAFSEYEKRSNISDFFSKNPDGYDTWKAGRDKFSDEAGKRYDSDVNTRKEIGVNNQVKTNQLLETGAGIFSLKDAQSKYDAKPQEKFALDYTNNQGILRSQSGGIPTSPLGLYEHPNQPVNVPTPDGSITMQGINYPVMAYPDNDTPKLMLPNQEYSFKNSSMVTEIPLMKNGGSTKISDAGKQRSKQLMNLLTSEGYSPKQAAAIIGNIRHETGDYKHMQELKPNSSRGGLGYLQYTGSRRTDFEKWSKSNGLNPFSEEANNKYLIHELESKKHWTRGKDAQFEQSDDINELSRAFEQGYLRPNPSTANSSRRQQYANEVYNDYASSTTQQVEEQITQQQTPRPEESVSPLSPYTFKSLTLKDPTVFKHRALFDGYDSAPNSAINDSPENYSENPDNMSNNKFAQRGKNLMKYQSSGDIYSGARVNPLAPIAALPTYFKAASDGSNTPVRTPIMPSAPVDVESKYTQPTMNDITKYNLVFGNSQQQLGALVGSHLKNKSAKNKAQSEADKINEAAWNKYYSDKKEAGNMNKKADILASIQATNAGNTILFPNKPALAPSYITNPNVQKLAANLTPDGKIPDTNITVANTVDNIAKADPKSKYNPVGKFYIPGENKARYDKDAEGNWYTQKNDGSSWVPISSLPKAQEAIDKLNTFAKEGPYSKKSKSSSKPANLSSSSESNTSADTTTVASSDSVERMNSSLGGNKFDNSRFTPSNLINNTPKGVLANTYSINKFDTLKERSEKLYKTDKYKNASWSDKLIMQAEVDPLSISEHSLGTAIPLNGVVGAAGKVMSKLPGVGKVVEYGGKYVDELGNYVSANGAKLGKAPKFVIEKTKEFFKTGSKPNPYADALAGKINSAGKYIDPLTKRFASAPTDTRGILQKAMQDTNLTTSFKNTLSSVATTGKKLSEKAYKALSIKEKQSYDDIIAKVLGRENQMSANELKNRLARAATNLVPKKQAGGFTNPNNNLDQQLFTHYYNSL